MARPSFLSAWAASARIYGANDPGTKVAQVIGGNVAKNIKGWSDAAGHATLWSGKSCYDHCHFNEPGATYTTDRANFWGLG